MQCGNLPVPAFWPFTGWCGNNCILSPCLWLYLLEQHLYLKIWTTVENIRRCFHIEFWEYFLVGLLADIMAIVPDGMYYAHLVVENIFDLLVSTFINKKRNFFLQEHWEQISFVKKFQHSRLWSALFFLLIADSLEKNDWTCPFVSHSSLERSWTTCLTCVSGRSHVRCDLRKVWFPACLFINIKSCAEVRLDFLAKPCPASP